ncbi:hypothetical protein GCM10007301_12740 [Azorhizobium oxalatiphilum]|uniref:YhaN AAA domain-containing protein n=1 Tax=Azorhizobium oxalatiphilum TaxID=980631 RepID=A0A917BST9_9HYPH|nr:YhaN family protein [Azorhizobium oxalatiphilum]GGF54661.1 hypothetical protein GCM10007301_12740 [Azorhizobium oxalatiphilum]
MKFLSLGLEKYGRFTDRTLTFDPQARLIVIHGANEAGKTTTLSAFADALFGFEVRSRFNFIHDYKTMRLSARIVRADGTELSFARLKRNKAPLVSPEDIKIELADDSLAPFLGGHDRRTFQEIFGLDQIRLRQGGHALLTGGGDLGEALLAAAPGLGRVASLRDALAKSAGEIFNPARRNSGNAFYVADDQWRQAREAIRAQELRVDEVNRLKELAEKAAAARAAAVAEASAREHASAQAQMRGHALKHIRQIDAQREAHAALGPLPDVPTGFLDAARAALSRAAAAREALARATQEEADAAQALAALPLDAPLLALEVDIRDGDEKRAAVAKELESLPKRRGEVAAARGGLDRIANALGLDGADAVIAGLPGSLLRTRADTLLGNLQAAYARAETLRGTQDKLAAHRRKITADAGAGGHAPDPAPLKQRLDALDGAEERERHLRTQGTRLAQDQQTLNERTRRLALGFADADDLACRPLPFLAAAEPALRRIRDEAEALRRLETNRAERGTELAQAQARLASLTAGRPAPTAQAIDAARHVRDTLWADLRPLATGARAAAPDDTQRADQLDQALVAADHLADERQIEATRLADLARTEREIAELSARAQSLDAEIARQAAQCEAATQDWASLWQASGLAAPATDAMLAALREADAIRQARDALLKAQADMEAQRAVILADRQQVERLRADLALPPLADGPIHMADARHAITGLDARFRAARDRARDLEAADGQARDLEAALAGLAQAQAGLAAEAQEIFPALALRVGASVEEGRMALDLWRQADTLIGTLKTAEDRVAGITRDEAGFTETIAALKQRAGLPAGGENPFTVAAELRRRLDAALQMRSKADLAQTGLDTRRATLARARQDLTQAGETLGAVLHTAGLADAEALPPLLGRLAEAHACADRMAQARAQLADLPGFSGEEAVRAAIAGADEETLVVQAAQAQDAKTSAEAALHTAIEQDTQAKAALLALDQRTGAAGAAQAAQDALLEVAGSMERFARDHAAARLLSVAIERYRERHHNPIVTRAATAFATLTGGAWSGIGVDYDNEPPRLAALREGRTFGIDTLSEGTADQLFLALRVAAIEDHAGRASPLPFIADDLFVTFDEARTAAGLTLLAELSAFTQVIVLTHHDHVASLAQTTLGPAAQVLRL